MAFDCLKKMYKEELYSDVIYFGNLLITAMDRCPDFMTQINRYQACVYYADACMQHNSIKRAEQLFMRALSIRKSVTASGKLFSETAPRRTGSSSSNLNSNNNNLNNNMNNLNDLTTENEVKFKLQICLVKQGKFKEAVGLLESIPIKNRAPKVNHALGNLYKRLNLNQPSTQAFKELLVACPYSSSAIVELLSAGADSEELRATLDRSKCDLVDCLGPQAGDWFSHWFSGNAAFAKRDYALAVEECAAIDTNTCLANSPIILGHLATSHYCNGDYVKACAIWQRVHSLDPLHMSSMDALASLLAEEKRLKELESLATKLIANAPDSRQSWVAMGYLCRSMKKMSKALFFAHKACGEARPRPYVEGMLLKGLVLIDLKQFKEAMMHFQEALQTNQHRYELYEGIVNCYLQCHQLKEARAAAALCLKQTGKTARALTLYATVLAKEPATVADAQTMLERAIAQAPPPNLMNAVILLVQLYDKSRQYDKALELLRRQTSVCVNSKLHGMLGDMLSKSSLHTQALDSYRFALTLDPNDELSLAGLTESGSQPASASALRPLSSDNVATTSSGGSAAVVLTAVPPLTSAVLTATITPDNPINAAQLMPPSAPLRLGMLASLRRSPPQSASTSTRRSPPASASGDATPDGTGASTDAAAADVITILDYDSVMDS